MLLLLSSMASQASVTAPWPAVAARLAGVVGGASGSGMGVASVSVTVKSTVAAISSKGVGTYMRPLMRRARSGSRKTVSVFASTQNVTGPSGSESLAKS